MSVYSPLLKGFVCHMNQIRKFGGVRCEISVEQDCTALKHPQVN